MNVRFLANSLIVLVAALAITACSSSSSSSSSTDTTSADNSAASTATSAAPADTSNAMTAASTEPAGGSSMSTKGLPEYPGATTEASGSSSNMGQAAAGKVLTTADSFDKVYAWYQKNMPAGSEKAHVTTPVQSAIFTVGEAGKDQQSVTITVQGGKTMITIAHVKM